MSKKWASPIVVAILLSVASCAEASPVRLTFVDRTGASFPDVLVIVKSLEGKGEVFRALTDANGAVPERELGPGLYRIIATCPYGICETKVEEFYVKDAPVQLKLVLDVQPTHGEGDVIEIGPHRQLKLQATDSNGQPARFVSVLVRDAEAQHERWYKTESDGSATVDLPKGPVTVVALFNGSLASKTFTTAAIDGLSAQGATMTIRLGSEADGPRKSTTPP